MINYFFIPLALRKEPEFQMSFKKLTLSKGFPGGSDDKESACNEGDLSLIPGLGRFPGEWLPTLVFWPGEFYGLYSPWSHKESNTTG